jgi:hypothetical protein
MRENYIRAVVGRDGLFSRLSDLFIREADTDTGPGMHYLVDLVGAGSDGVQVVSIVCENHDIPIRDFRKHTMLPIRDLVTKILECSPPRCAIILDTRDNELMLKVRGVLPAKRAICASAESSSVSSITKCPRDPAGRHSTSQAPSTTKRPCLADTPFRFLCLRNVWRR